MHFLKKNKKKQTPYQMENYFTTVKVRDTEQNRMEY